MPYRYVLNFTSKNSMLHAANFHIFRINRSASMLSGIGAKQNGAVVLKHHTPGDQQYSSLTDLNNGK